MPKDGFCDDCGNHEFEPVLDDLEDEDDLNVEENEIERTPKEEVLAFYNHLGLLVDFELKHGFESYENLKR